MVSLIFYGFPLTFSKLTHIANAFLSFFFFLEHQTAKPRVLHALFLFQEPRGIVPCKFIGYLNLVTYR